MVIIILGPPGAGKGTQSKVLAEKISLPHISTGDILRQNVSNDTQLGRKAKDYMNKGLLVPDELVTQMLRDRVNSPDTKAGFILDGYPRNISQAEALEEILKENNRVIDIAFYLDTSDAVIIQRLSGRLVCSKCNANFHITNMPPKNDRICDYCKGSLYQRQDDKEETVKKRIEVYKKEVSPLIEYYQKQKKLESLSADKEASFVLNQMLGIIKKHDPS